MNTYLFVWNPKRWTWDTLENDISIIDEKGSCSVTWSCGVNKSIKQGDRAFLVRVGLAPKGIIGAGFVTTEPTYGTHWGNENKEALYADIDFEFLLNPNHDPILSLDILNAGVLRHQNWTPQSSGISIRAGLVDELETLWFDFLAAGNGRHQPFAMSSTQAQNVFVEGASTRTMQTKYERNPFARKVCIDHYGLSCSVCTFNFEDVYGELGKDFIHVHHLTSIASIGIQHIVDPVEDLRPVCPNCHAMLHRQEGTMSIDDLKLIVASRKINS